METKRTCQIKKLLLNFYLLNSLVILKLRLHYIDIFAFDHSIPLKLFSKDTYPDTLFKISIERYKILKLFKLHMVPVNWLDTHFSKFLFPVVFIKISRISSQYSGEI